MKVESPDTWDNTFLGFQLSSREPLFSLVPWEAIYFRFVYDAALDMTKEIRSFFCGFVLPWGFLKRKLSALLVIGCRLNRRELGTIKSQKENEEVGTFFLLLRQICRSWQNFWTCPRQLFWQKRQPSSILRSHCVVYPIITQFLESSIILIFIRLKWSWIRTEFIF